MHNDVVLKIKELREESKRENKRNLIGAWRERDRLNGEVVDSFVVILRTRGCRWAKISGCSMCGYYNDTNPQITEEDMMHQIEDALSKYKGEKYVKIYTSGSFLDDGEVPESVQKKIFESFSGAERIVVETRPEFVNREKANMLKSYGNVMVALGLESVNDETLLFRINKGFLVRHYLKAVDILKEKNVKIKTYALLKPPFMSEADAIREATEAILFAAKHSEVVSLNPMNIQKNTLVEYLWKRGEYRPPWLWSIVEALKRTYGATEIVSYPTGAGTTRGAHNCGKCDEKVIKAIYQYSWSQDISYLDGLKCPCKEKWERIVKYGAYFWDYSVDSIQ